MSEKKSPYSRFWEATLASTGQEEAPAQTKKAKPPPARPQPLRRAEVHQFMGRVSVAGNIIILGSVSPNAVEMILGKRSGGQGAQ